MDEEGREGAWTLSTVKFLLLGVAAAAFMFIAGVFIGDLTTRRAFQIEAVKQGHAEYIINKDYEREWRWLPPCSKKEEKK